MKNNKKSSKISDSKRKKRPKVRFNIWMLIIIFVLSFAGFFILYMIAANLDDDFFTEESSLSSSETTNPSAPDASYPDETTSENPTDNAAETPAHEEISYPIPVSAAVDISYLDSCCLITDKTLLSIKDHTEFKDVLGSENLSAVTVNTAKIESSYGTVISYEAIKLKKPMNIYIMLGSDLGVSSIDDMITEYTNLVTSLKASLANSKIYVMQLPPIAADSGTLTNALIDDYNSRLLTMAKNCGVYCLDTNIDLKSNEGALKPDYTDAETGELNAQFYKDICGYILTHTV